MQTRRKDKPCLPVILPIFWQSGSNKDLSALTQHYYLIFVCGHYGRINLPITSQTKEANRMATSDMNLVTLCAVAGCCIKRVASSKFSFWQLRNAIDTNKRPEKTLRNRRNL